MIIKPYNYQEICLVRLGLDREEFTEEDFLNARADNLAEIIIKKRIPTVMSVTDEIDEFHIQEAFINYMCYLICPALQRKLLTSGAGIDLKWTKDKVNWEHKAQEYLAMYENSLNSISSITVNTITGYDIITKVTRDRYSIGDGPGE